MSRNTRFNGTKRPDLTGIVGRNPAISPAHAVSQPLTRKESTAARNLLSMSVSNSRVNRRNALSKKAVNRKTNTRTNAARQTRSARLNSLAQSSLSSYLIYQFNASVLLLFITSRIFKISYRSCILSCRLWKINAGVENCIKCENTAESAERQFSKWFSPTVATNFPL